MDNFLGLFLIVPSTVCACKGRISRLMRSPSLWLVSYLNASEGFFPSLCWSSLLQLDSYYTFNNIIHAFIHVIILYTLEYWGLFLCSIQNSLFGNTCHRWKFARQKYFLPCIKKTVLFSLFYFILFICLRGGLFCCQLQHFICAICKMSPHLKKHE